MSHITETGNLAAVPELRTSKAGKSWASARALHTYRVQDQGTGEWADGATIGYDLIVTGRHAEQLVATAAAKHHQTGKQLAIMFAGTHRVETFTRRDDTSGTSHKVMVDQWAILPDQDITLTRNTTN